MRTTRLAERLKALRAIADLSQEALAAKSSVSLRTVCRLEAGAERVNRSTLALLAQALGVTVDELVLAKDDDDENGEAA